MYPPFPVTWSSVTIEDHLLTVTDVQPRAPHVPTRTLRSSSILLLTTCRSHLDKRTSVIQEFITFTFGTHYHITSKTARAQTVLKLLLKSYLLISCLLYLKAHQGFCVMPCVIMITIIIKDAMSDFWPQTLKKKFFWVNGISKSITHSNEKTFNFHF